MTIRLPVPAAPAPLEGYAARFDDLFARRSQRAAYRRSLEGPRLPAERYEALIGLANTEPATGAQHPRAQGRRWFPSEATWPAQALDARRLALLRADPAPAPDRHGALVIDEHGDRKWGRKTAHVGRQYLANPGKADSGGVSVTSLWADARASYPPACAPYTPEHHFATGNADPAFRAELRIAGRSVTAAVTVGVPFCAVVAGPDQRRLPTRHPAEVA